MRAKDDELLYLAVGPLAAIGLGLALIPVREVTSASNFAFLFLILTIVVAELGGRWPAVATALVSALSLDFFLTKPYLHLAIGEKHDLIAFAALAVCGLVVATLGARRGERLADLRALRQHHGLLHSALRELETGGALQFRAERLVATCQSTLPVAALALRDNQNHLVAAAPTARPVPASVLSEDGLEPSVQPDGSSPTVVVPAEGGRLPLTVDGRPVGWLDVYGGRKPLDLESYHTLTDVARVAAALLDQRPWRPR